MEALQGEEWKQKFVDYLLQHGTRLEFKRYFWKGCEPLPSDVTYFRRFVEEFTEPTMWINYDHIQLRKMPKLAHFLKAMILLGKPQEGFVWLTLEQSHGHAVPVGQFVQVPISIERWDDVATVISQIVPRTPSKGEFTRPYLFGFLVGMILGDGHKPKQGHSHRHLSLVLSKKYDSNLRIGDFTSYCANQFGLRMNRSNDLPKPPHKPFGFFVWNSQSSPFLDWIFNVVMGLEDGQNTTYDAVNMDWALESPEDFRIGLIQGIAESDGSVSISGQEVEFWVLPDWDFMIKLLATFGLRGFRNREAVSLAKSQAIASFNVPVFAPHLRTIRYERLELMAKTKKLARVERLPEDVREEITRLASGGHSVPTIVQEIARTKKLLVSFEAAQRWAKKARPSASQAIGQRMVQSESKE